MWLILLFVLGISYVFTLAGTLILFAWNKTLLRRIEFLELRCRATELQLRTVLKALPGYRPHPPPRLPPPPPPPPPSTKIRPSSNFGVYYRKPIAEILKGIYD